LKIYKTLFKVVVSMVSAALGFVMLSLQCKQRRKFVEHQNQDEHVCASFFAIWCCSPCAYGQMGSTQIV